MNASSKIKLLSSTALLGAAMLTLSACANPIEGLMQQGTENTIEKLIEAESGGKVDIDLESGGVKIEGEDGDINYQAGSGVSLPDSWPGLPLPQGELVMSTISGDVIALTFNSSEAAFKKLINDLENEGFAIDQSSDSEFMKIYVLKNAAGDEVSISALIDGGQVQLSYIVTANG